MNLEQVRRFALSLPEVMEEPHFEYTSFRIRGKIIATAPPDGEHLHIFVGDQVRDLALATEPAFLEKLFWGNQVRGLRVLLARAKPRVVNELVREAWIRRAPKALVAASQRPPVKRRT
jgi:hypothetical protein